MKTSTLSLKRVKEELNNAVLSGDIDSIETLALVEELSRLLKEGDVSLSLEERIEVIKNLSRLKVRISKTGNKEHTLRIAQLHEDILENI